MTEQEKKEMQEELDKLKKVLQEQHRTIAQLEEKLLGSDTGQKQNSPVSKQSEIHWSIENFIGLRLIHFIGIIVLVIGLSIGVKYAIDRNLISVGMRLFIAYGAGVLLYIFSLRLRRNYSVFSAILFSGGIASLYFTTYAAHVYYNLFSFPLAFGIMIFFTVYTVYEASRYNRQEIALLALIGAYAIPFLISKNADKPELFFLYISLLDSGVVYLTIRKGWKNVGRAAQALTWVLFLVWASRKNPAGTHWIGSAFISFFFLLFLVNSLLYKVYQKKKFTINDNYQLALNTVAVYLASLFVFANSFANAAIAWITILLCALSVLQLLVFSFAWKEEFLTRKAFASLSLIFFVLFIGFNWSGFVVTLLWLLTAVVIFSWGFVMKSVTARMMAIILMGATLAKLLALDSLSFSAVQKVIAYVVLGILLLVVSFFYQKFREKIFERKEV
ncbi:MAG: DUF2339 domain-containing protein [Flavisolibacter sp.]